MIRVAIVSKPLREELFELLPELIDWLRQHGFEPVLDSVSSQYSTAAPVVDRTELPALAPELVIVLGGDGTLLSAAHIFAATGTPILSVNLGYLGFLTEVPLADLYTTLESWFGCRHTLDERAMLHAELWREGVLCSSNEALNDIVVSKGDIARMGEYEVEMAGKNVASFRSDGVIISTSTGSTAYSLSANGPILTPDVDAMVVTPICPHLLTLRPIVVRGDAFLTIRIKSKVNQTLLTVDGQTAIELQLYDEIRCRKSEYSVKLVRLSEGGFFEALRSKLSWGER